MQLTLRLLPLLATLAALPPALGNESIPQPPPAAAVISEDALALAELSSPAGGPDLQVQAPAATVPPDEAAERARLSALPRTRIQAPNTPLRSLIRFLAEQAEMNYITLLPPSDEERLVSLSVTANPWEVLGTLSASYQFGMTFERGLWHIFPLRADELVARIYRLRHNTLETFSGGSASGSGSSQQAQGSGVSPTPASASSPSTSSTGLSSLQGAGSGSSLRSDHSALLDAVREVLGIEAGDAPFAASPVDSATPGAPPDLESARRGSRRPAAAPRTTVHFNADENLLYVVATREQHARLEGLLESIDRPHRQVAIETKIIETSRDRSASFGIDWTGVTGSPSLSLSGLQTSVDLGSLGSTAWPRSAILSASDLRIGLSALSADSEALTVQYPRVVTINNRPVSLRSVVQRPVLQSTTTISGSGLTGSQTTQSVTNIDVGTVIDVLPKVFSGPDGDRILLNVVLSVSNITGTATIQGNTYPITSNRLFNYQVIVGSGQTLAIGGLEETVDTTSVNRVPGLGSVPFFGIAFSKRQPARNNRTLMMLVTPTLLETGSGGLAERAGLPPAQPSERRLLVGSPDESLEDLHRSAGSLRREMAELRILAHERRARTDDLRRLDLIDNEIELLAVAAQEAVAGDEVPAHALDGLVDSLRREVRQLRDTLRSSLRLRLTR